MIFGRVVQALFLESKLLKITKLGEVYDVSERATEAAATKL